MNEYIILEIVPTSMLPEKGFVAQLSAIKVNGLAVVDRFDFRLNPEHILIAELNDLLSYDKDEFVYKNTTDEIMQEFKNWAGDHELRIIDNSFTKSYLLHYGLQNKIDSVFELLNMKYHDLVINDIMQKYNLQPSNHIVDLLFEAIVYEGNTKES